MKQTITALLLALALVLGLSGCTAKKDSGTDKNNNDTTQNGTNNGNTNNGTLNGGTNNGEGNNGTTDNNSVGSRSYDSYAQPGVNGPTSSDSVNDLMRGRSYEEMLRNGRVNDTDGFLNDGENSVSQW